MIAAPKRPAAHRRWADAGSSMAAGDQQFLTETASQNATADIQRYMEIADRDASTADLKSHHKRRVDQGLQIDQAVLESISLRVPMTFRNSADGFRWSARGPTSRDHLAWEGIDEADPQALAPANPDFLKKASVDGVDRRRAGGISAGRNRCAVAFQPPTLDQKDLVAIHLHWLAFAHYQRQGANRPWRTVAEQRGIEKIRSGMRERELELVARGRSQRRTRKQWLDRGYAVDTAPVESHRCGDVVGKTDFRPLAALEMKRPISQRPYRCRRLFLSQAEQAFLAAKHWRRLSADRAIWRMQGDRREARHRRAPVQPKHVI